jgi:DNA-directed RNA polymerase subunit L
MNVKILEDKKKRLVFELEGSDHGFCNALKQELWNDSAVTIASYTIEHPLVGVPRFIVETNAEKEPKAVLKGAIARLRKNAEEFKSEVTKIR